MRKTFGVLFAAALMLPIGVIAAAPAGSAAATPTCTAAKGTFKFTPPLPASGGVISNLSSAGTVSGCTGGGVTSGKTSFVQTVKSTTKSSCATLAKPTGKPTIGKFVVTWNNKKTSTATGFKVTQSKTTVTNASTTGKITAGLFKGKSITGAVTFKLATSGSGASLKCTGGTYTNVKGVKFVIK
jgi:hypothetical protein